MEITLLVCVWSMTLILLAIYLVSYMEVMLLYSLRRLGPWVHM